MKTWKKMRIAGWLCFAGIFGLAGVAPSRPELGGVLFLAFLVLEIWSMVAAAKDPDAKKSKVEARAKRAARALERERIQARALREQLQGGDSELEALVFWELQRNSKISAIKLVRERTGFSLYEAKVFVENLEIGMPLADCQFAETLQAPEVDSVSAVDGMDGHVFEEYCARLLRENGFTDVSVTPGSGDQGVDVLATKDGIKYAIQCKNYASSLGNTPIQEVNAGKTFYKCHVGVVMTNSTFTVKAKELAAATGVLLWDRKKLQELIAASNAQLKVVSRQKQGACEDVAEKKKHSTVHVVQAPASNLSVALQTPLRTAGMESPRDANKFATKPRFPNKDSVVKTENVDGVQISVHVGSASAVNLTLGGFGIDKDDEDPDEFTLLFDVEAQDIRGIPEDITIVCNAFAGNQKLATEYEYLYKKSFWWKDSLEVYFDKKNLATRTTRIEIFCKRG